jgi:tetratricopeptide (TPR) repeat protein
VVWGFLSARRSRRETTADSRLSLRESSARFPERNAAAAARQRLRRLSRALENRPYLAVGWLWYLVMLLPVIGLVQVGIGNAADRFTYLPQIGLGVALVWAGFDICRGWTGRRRAWAAAAAVLALLFLGGACWCQTYFWHDSATLWSHAVDCTPRNWLAHNNLGNALIARGEWQQALDQFREALAIDPDSSEARVNAAAMLAALGHPDEAAVEYRKALEAAAPGNPKTFVALGDFLFGEGQFDRAMSYYCSALAIDRHCAPAHDRIGRILAHQGDDARAVAEYEKSLALEPDSVEALNDLAWLRASSSAAALRDADRAVRLARRADELAGGQRPDVLDTLAASCAAGGQFAEAVAAARQALALPQLQREPSLRDLLQQRIKLYEAKTPLHRLDPSSRLHQQWRPGR